jgi:hypothetical protein
MLMHSSRVEKFLALKENEFCPNYSESPFYTEGIIQLFHENVKVLKFTIRKKRETSRELDSSAWEETNRSFDYGSFSGFSLLRIILASSLRLE